MAKYEVIYSNQFKKSLKKMLKQGKDLRKLDSIISFPISQNVESFLKERK